MISREEVLDALRPIVDPEIHLSIVDLGLIYDAIITVSEDKETEGDADKSEGNSGSVEAGDLSPEEGTVTLEVKMTLTTPMCPYGPMLVQQVTDVVSSLPYIDDAKVTLVWDPPWDPKTMASDEVKDKMGIW